MSPNKVNKPQFVVNDLGILANNSNKNNHIHKNHDEQVDEFQIIGKSECSVAEVDEMLSYIKDISFSAENLLSSSQDICKNKMNTKDHENIDFKKEIYKSAIGVANAIKDLCDATNISLSSGSTTKSGDRMSTATKKVANSTGQLLLNLKPTVIQNKPQIEKIHTHGNQIKKNADLLLNHLNYINDRKWGDDRLFNKNSVTPMNEVIDNQSEVLGEQKDSDVETNQINQTPILYEEKTNSVYH